MYVVTTRQNRIVSSLIYNEHKARINGFLFLHTIGIKQTCSQSADSMSDRCAAFADFPSFNSSISSGVGSSSHSSASEDCIRVRTPFEKVSRSACSTARGSARPWAREARRSTSPTPPYVNTRVRCAVAKRLSLSRYKASSPKISDKVQRAGASTGNERSRKHCRRSGVGDLKDKSCI